MTGFADEAQVHVKAGNGGAGSVSFRREAHVSRGGPDGGDGGDGGDVWLVASTNQASLLGFRDHPHRRATDGKHGQGKKRHGRGVRGSKCRCPWGRWCGGPTERCWPIWPPPVTAGWLPAVGGGARQRPLSHQPPAGTGLRRAGRSRRGALARPRAQAAGRRGPRGAAQFGQEHSDLPHLGGSTQGGGLSLHHPRAPSRRGPGGPARRRDRVRGGRRSRASWKGRPRDEVSVTGSSATSNGPERWWCCSTWRPPTRCRRREQQRILLDELGRYRPELLERPRLVVGSKGDVASASVDAQPELTVSAVTGAGDPRAPCSPRRHGGRGSGRGRHAQPVRRDPPPSVGGDRGGPSRGRVLRGARASCASGRCPVGSHRSRRRRLRARSSAPARCGTRSRAGGHTRR